jgi:hypothetical protein
MTWEPYFVALLVVGFALCAFVFLSLQRSGGTACGQSDGSSFR